MFVAKEKYTSKLFMTKTQKCNFLPGFVSAEFGRFHVSHPEVQLCRQKPDSHERVHRIGIVDTEELRRHRRSNLRQSLLHVRGRHAVCV